MRPAARNALELLPELEAALRVEPGRGLVEEQDLRIAGERAGDREALALAAGELADARVPLLLEREILEQPLRVAAARVERAEEIEHLEDGQLLGEPRLLERDAEARAELPLVLSPAAAEDLDVSGVGAREPLEDLDRRGLAGAVRPEKAEAFARPDLQIQPVHRADVAESASSGRGSGWRAQRRRLPPCSRSWGGESLDSNEGK